MFHIPERVLLPDRLELEKLRSLNGIRDELARKGSVFRKAVEDRDRSEVSPRNVTDATDSIGSFVDLLVTHASTGAVSLVVALPRQSIGFCISRAAWKSSSPAFLAHETIYAGHFIVVPGLFPYGALEPSLDGAPIFAESAPIKNLLGSRPTPQAQLQQIIQAEIDALLECGMRITRNDMIQRIQSREDVYNVSDNQIEIIYNKLKPKRWARPGRPPRNVGPS